MREREREERCSLCAVERWFGLGLWEMSQGWVYILGEGWGLPSSHISLYLALPLHYTVAGWLFRGSGSALAQVCQPPLSPHEAGSPCDGSLLVSITFACKARDGVRIGIRREGVE